MTRRYPAYRESGIDWLGEVPQHWDVGPLKRRYTVTLGKMLQPEPKSEEDTFAQYLRAANIQWGMVDVSDMNSMWFSPADRKALTLNTGDLLVSEGGDVGRSAIWQGELEECYFQNSVNRVRPQENASTAYLFYWMATIKAKGYVDVLCNKSTIAHFTAEKVAAVPVPMPPLPEQIAVAAFLDRETAKIDALVAEQRRLIDLLREKRQAVISHAVTKGLNPNAPLKPSGIDWLGDVPEGWEVGPLKRFWSVTDCKHVTADFIDEGFPLASIREVQSRFIDLSEAKCTTEDYYTQLIEGRRKPLPGDLIFSRNATVGEVSQVSSWHPPFAMGQDVCLLRRIEEDFSPDYMQAFFDSSFVAKQLDVLMIGATFKRVNVDAIRNLLVVCPPASEQAIIADQISAKSAGCDALTATAETAIALLQERRAALISAAVTGKIDVRHLARNEEEGHAVEEQVC